nr:EamA family transporter [Actinorugispora endophytica]
MVVLQAGSAFAVRLFDSVGPGGVTWLRLSWAALVLLALGGRPLWRAVRAARRRELGAVALLGAVSAGMMVAYSEAAARIDLGTATAIEFLGPLAVAVLAMRRRRELAWIAVAVAGVLCLTRPWTGEADLVGAGFALAGAACVTLYITLAQRVGSSFTAVHGLALAMTVAAVVTTPLGLPGVVAARDGRALAAVLAATLVIALLYPLLPLLLEMVVLQRMSRTAFSTFASVEPAISLLMGVLVIAQTPAPVQLAGMALVVAAGIGSARGDAAGRRVDPPRPGGDADARAPEAGRDQEEARWRRDAVPV